MKENSWNKNYFNSYDEKEYIFELFSDKPDYAIIADSLILKKSPVELQKKFMTCLNNIIPSNINVSLLFLSNEKVNDGRYININTNSYIPDNEFIQKLRKSEKI